MLALQITSMKAFMNHLLVADTFENFLLAEATVSTANTYQIDGHINKDFYTQEELSIMVQLSRQKSKTFIMN